MDEQTQADVAKLAELAGVVHDSDDVNAYCQGIGITPEELGDIIDRVQAVLAGVTIQANG